jgi:hypothetical protein
MHQIVCLDRTAARSKALSSSDPTVLSNNAVRGCPWKDFRREKGRPNHELASMVTVLYYRTAYSTRKEAGFEIPLTNTVA